MQTGMCLPLPTSSILIFTMLQLCSLMSVARPNDARSRSNSDSPRIKRMVHFRGGLKAHLAPTMHPESQAERSFIDEISDSPMTFLLWHDC